MIRFLFTSSFVILFLIFSIPILLIEWVVGKHNPDLKNKTTQNTGVGIWGLKLGFLKKWLRSI